MTVSTSLTLTGAVIAATLLATLQDRSRSNVVSAGFWFDEGVTFDLYDPVRLGRPLTADERDRIKRVARAEVAHAFREFRLRVVDGRNAFYRVSVQQSLTSGFRTPERWTGAAGQSHVLGPLGGYGDVSFQMVAAQAMSFAPPGASRADIIDGIGRGIGRAAAHEFAHQILPNGPLHTSQDEASYEYGSSNRVAQYYGEMHWSVARPVLIERLGR